MEYFVVGRSIDGTVYLGEHGSESSRKYAQKLTLEQAQEVMAQQQKRNARLCNMDYMIGRLGIIPVKE
jgi:hypothetical protein